MGRGAQEMAVDLSRHEIPPTSLTTLTLLPGRCSCLGEESARAESLKLKLEPFRTLALTNVCRSPLDLPPELIYPQVIHNL